jgi:hypothetical protein
LDATGWIDLAEDRDMRRDVVNTVMNLGLHKILVNFGVAEQLATSQERLSSMKLVGIL